MEIWKLVITLKTDFHTAGVTKGSTIDVLKDEKCVYIPASHIKGVIRTEAERIIKGLNKELRIVDILFGPEEQESKSDGEYIEPKLKFLDAVSSIGKIIERHHVKIEIETGSSEGHALFTQKTIPAGTVFTSFMFIRGNGGLTPEEKKLLDAAIMSTEHYGLGGSRSSGLGSVAIEWKKSSINELREVLG